MCTGEGGDSSVSVSPISIPTIVPEVSVSLDLPELPTLDDVTDVVDHNLGQVGNVLHHNLSQVQEGILEPIGKAITTTVSEGPVEAYQGSDIDTTLEGFQEIGVLIYDAIDSVASGKPKGKVEEAGSAIGDAGEVYSDVLTDIGEAGQDIMDLTEDTISTTINTTGEISENIRRHLSGEPSGADVIDREETEGGEVLREGDFLQLSKKKSDLRAKKKKGKKGLRIDYGVSLPGSGKSGIAA